MCVLILYTVGGTYSLESTRTGRFFHKLANLFTLEFLPEIAEEILFVFCFDVWRSNPGFTSNKPTDYQLDYGDFMSQDICDENKEYFNKNADCFTSNNLLIEFDLFFEVCKIYIRFNKKKSQKFITDLSIQLHIVSIYIINYLKNNIITRCHFYTNKIILPYNKTNGNIIFTGYLHINFMKTRLHLVCLFFI